jgi:hypothetical protein
LYEKGCYLLHGEPVEERVSGKKRYVESGLLEEPKSQKNTGTGHEAASSAAGGGDGSESDSGY